MNNRTGIVFRFAPDIYDEENNQTMLEIYRVQGTELNGYENIIYRIFLNNYIMLADIEGIRRFEAIYNIKADETTETIDFRRARLINKLATLPPFTKIFLEQMLNTIFGEDNVHIDIIYNEYRLQIMIDTDIENLFEETMKEIRQIIPANIILEEYQLTPYTHRYLNRYYTHQQMEQFDYNELSRYAE